MLESQSTPLKTRRTTWFPIKFQVKKLALDIGALGLIIFSKYALTYFHYDVINKATNIWNFPTFIIKLKLQDFSHLLSVWTALLLNWLASYGLQPIWPRSPFAWHDFSSKFRFQSHNFRSRNGKKPIIGSNDLNYSLVSNKTLGQKLGNWFDAQGPMTSDKMRVPTPIMTSPTRKPKP